MNSTSNFFNRFKRITTSGNYYPEIDGLRFIAIFMVVALFHTAGLYTSMIIKNKTAYDFTQQIIARGYYGVELFFIISGFTLSLPFIKQKLYGTGHVNIKDYFIRRITRIEPLYIITLILYFIVRVWILKYQSFTEVLPHLAASLLYLHNFIYNDFPLVNGVTWSLEVEIQFYILAPILTAIFYIKNTYYRYLIFMVLIVLGAVKLFYLHINNLGNFINFSCFFFAGMFLGDLYLSNKKSYNGVGYLLVAIVAFTLVLLLEEPLFGIFNLMLLILSMIFFFLALTNNILKKCLSNKIISCIGGMCYTIYLLHQGVFGILRYRLPGVQFTRYAWFNGLIAYLITIAAILFISGIFFLLIEKPTMKKDWHTRIFNRT